MESSDGCIVGEKMKSLIQLTKEPIVSRSAAVFVRDSIALLSQMAPSAEGGDGLESESADEVLAELSERVRNVPDAADRSWAAALSGVLVDLTQQGWVLQYKSRHLWGRRPGLHTREDGDENRDARAPLRQRMLVRRDQQLRKASIRDFVQGMERWRLYRGARTSVLTLMRDGRELAAGIASGTRLDDLIDPYIQFVSSDAICEKTGLRLQDIWRYFRHTWSSPYESVPGRSLQFLVRDKSAPFHPVIGIAALSSAAVRLGPRDRFIGWDTDQVVERLLKGDESEARQWANRVLRTAVDEIYKVDLIRDQILPADASCWSMATAAECAQAATVAKAQHHRLMEAQEYKASDDVSSEEACIARAELYLFRAKRAHELSKLIPLLLRVDTVVLRDPAGEDLIGKVVRIARSKTVGTEIADLTVCGAIAPYSHLAAGKLVAMLAVSPPVITEYKRRYANSPGIIASSMAGRPLGRPANLCFIATTSLFGKRPSQYDRLSTPADLLGGASVQRIKYHHIDDKNDVDSTRTKGVGSFHFSASTLKALEQFVSSRKGGWKANNLFGEGTSPKLRGLRDGLVALGLEAEPMLVHGIERCMYGVKLAANVDRYLLGIDQQPEWIVDVNCRDTSRLSAWWLDRWAAQRAKRDDVIAAVRYETLAHPIRHRARVRLPEREGTQSLFPGDGGREANG